MMNAMEYFTYEDTDLMFRYSVDLDALLERLDSGSWVPASSDDFDALASGTLRPIATEKALAIINTQLAAAAA